MDVLVFRTSVTRVSQVGKVKELLTGFPHIHEVSVDLEDCDKVLRVVGENPSPRFIELLVSSLGVSCTEMDDCLQVAGT